jgi:aspartate/methionine/tyrosine aminotransferase
VGRRLEGISGFGIDRDDANSYLPFSGLDEMKQAVAELIERRGGPRYDPYSEIVITDGGYWSRRSRQHR